MEKGRRKIRICLIGIVLAAVVAGACYYFGGDLYSREDSGGTLVRENWEVCHVC